MSKTEESTVLQAIESFGSMNWQERGIILMWIGITWAVTRYLDNRSIGNAKEEAKQLRERLATMPGQSPDRKLTDTEKEKLVKEIRAIGLQPPIYISSVNDPEAAQYAREIGWSLEEAGIAPFRPPGSVGKYFPPTVTQAGTDKKGLLVATKNPHRPSDNAIKMMQALTKLGMKAHYEEMDDIDRTASDYFLVVSYKS